MGMAAALIALGVAVWYVVLIYEGRVSPDGAEVYGGGVTLLLFAQAYVIFQGTLRFSVPVMALGTAMLLITSFVSLFTIGAPLALAGILAALATGYVRLRQQLAADRRRGVRPPPRR